MGSFGRASKGRTRWVILVTVALLTICVGSPLLYSPAEFSAAASQSGEEPKLSQVSLPSSDETRGAIESQPPHTTDPGLTDPKAGQSVAHQDLGRSEALGLLDGVFGGVLEDAAGIFDELQVKRFLAPNVAVISAGDQPAPLREGSNSDRKEGPTLIDSSIPLRVDAGSGEEKAVDLRLKRSGGGLQSANPLVEVGMPEELGKGIDLPESGVRVKLAEAPIERSPSIVNESVAGYPNVAQDTDFAVAPTPTGFETLIQLRSPEAPRSQTYDLTLPIGATLETERGGAKVVDADDEIIVGIAPPTAIDAAGAEVPVRLSVSGKSLTVTASPGESAKFPILVDPIYQTYEWYAKKIQKEYQPEENLKDGHTGQRAAPTWVSYRTVVKSQRRISNLPLNITSLVCTWLTSAMPIQVEKHFGLTLFLATLATH